MYASCSIYWFAPASTKHSTKGFSSQCFTVSSKYLSLKLDGDSLLYFDEFTEGVRWEGTNRLLLGFKKLLFSLVSVTGKISIRLYDFNGELEYRSLPVFSDKVQEKSTSELEKAGLKSTMGTRKSPPSQAEASFKTSIRLLENISVPSLLK